MKITRYFQSCLLVEEADTRILIDPSGHEKDNVDKFGKLDAVLITHEHSDHFDAGLTAGFIDKAVPVYLNAGTAKQLDGQANVITNEQELEVGGLKLKALELPHCLMWDGSEGPQNTGYLINGRFFHPGDGKEIEGLELDILALPINGPDISMKDAYDFARQTKAKNVVPIHYDYLGTRPEVFGRHGKGFGFETHALDIGESKVI